MDTMTCSSPDFLAHHREEQYCRKFLSPDAKNSFRDPTQTYLESPWTLWLINKNGTQKKTWMDCIHPVATFSTIQQFWGMYNTLKPPSELPSYWEYALFRGGIARRVIVPDWDDSENAGGGCMQFSGFNLDAKVVDHLWRDICLKAIEEAWIHTSDYINGTIVSTKAGTTRFYVWIAPCKEHIWETVRDRIESVFAQDCQSPLKWTPHTERKPSHAVREQSVMKERSLVAVTRASPVKVPPFFRSRSVGYRAKLDVDVKTDEYLKAKRMAQPAEVKEAKVHTTKKLYMPSVKGSVSTILFRQNYSGSASSSNQTYVGHRRGRSCHGLKAYPESSLFNMPSRDHGRNHQGSGDISSLVGGKAGQSSQLDRVTRALAAMNAGMRSKEMVDVSTQFNAKTTSGNMAAGDSGGPLDLPAAMDDSKT